MRPDQRHPTAEIHATAIFGEDAEVLQFAVVRENVQVGKNTRICSHVYLDAGVTIGADCKIKNHACVYSGVVVGNGVFVGPHAQLINDDWPRSRYRKGPPYPRTVIQEGATIGAGAVVLPGVEVGKNSMVGAGAVVTGDVEEGATVVGTPARAIEPSSDADHFASPPLDLAEQDDPKKTGGRG